MSVKRLASSGLHCLRVGLASVVMFQLAIGASVASAATAQTAPDTATTSPIKHVIVIIGENRSFDHVFATYKPKHGETVMNLLSEGIVNADGTPGPNFYKTPQLAASDLGPTDTFLLNPPKTPYSVLPAPLVGGTTTSYVSGANLTPPVTLTSAQLLKLAKQSENGLAESYYPDLLSGGTGLASK